MNNFVVEPFLDSFKLVTFYTVRWDNHYTMPSQFFKEAIADRDPSMVIFMKKYLDLIERIQELLEQKGMTQNDLAVALDLQPSVLDKILKNKNNNLTLKSIARIEAFFGQEILTVTRLQPQ